MRLLLSAVYTRLGLLTWKTMARFRQASLMLSRRLVLLKIASILTSSMCREKMWAGNELLSQGKLILLVQSHLVKFSKDSIYYDSLPFLGRDSSTSPSSSLSLLLLPPNTSISTCCTSSGNKKLTQNIFFRGPTSLTILT